MENNSKLEQLYKSLNNIKTKSFKIIAFVPDTQNVASAAVAEIYNFINTLRKEGYDGYILADKKGYQAPTYLEQELQAIPHLYSEDGNMIVTPEDFIIIPEYFVNIMEQCKNLPATKIVLAQSYDNIVNGLIGGMTWKNFNIKNVITTSSKISDFIKKLHGDNYDIKEYVIGIPEYFQPAKFKNPLVTFLSRNNQDIVKVSKMFYLQNPDLTWVMFEDLKGTTREHFASKLAQSSVTVWIDRLASFGTLPIEAMASGSLVVGLLPEITPEYIHQQSSNGVWVSNIYDLPKAIGDAVRASIHKNIPQAIYTDMSDTANTYTKTKSDDSILSVFEYYRSSREVELEKMAKAFSLKEERIKSTKAVIIVEEDEE
jgi:hypothetical protein